MATQSRKKRLSSPVSRHKIREVIQKRILQGTYTTGTRLRQVQLAEEFGVSQSVIRESLLELRAIGLVDMKDQLGAFVSTIDSRKLKQAYEIREMMEGLAARLCCDQISREELRELEQLAERIRNLPPDKLDERAHLDREFHKRLIQISRSDMLIKIAESYEVLKKFSRAKQNQEQGQGASPDEHYKLLEPIRDNQPDEAERRMREHIRHGWKTISQALDSGVPLQWVD